MLEAITTPVPTTTASSSTQVIVFFPIGLLVLAIPLVILLVGVILSVSNPAFRKTIRVALSVVGVLEVVPFFINLVKDISGIIPFVPLLILFIEGCVTLISGVAIFYLPKPDFTKKQ